MKHIVCFSGGHSSAVVAIAVAKRYGSENTILLNHDISSFVEDEDIKRFKNEVAAYLNIDITYANMANWESKDQFDVSIEAKAFKTKDTPAICTNRLKTAPFMEFMQDIEKNNCIVYYGFDKSENVRIERRSMIMSEFGYKTEYPLASWESLPVNSTIDIGIIPPLKYTCFKHANCTGCLKGGMQHWYVVYCNRTDVWEKGKEAEAIIGYSIIKGFFLKDLECKFEKMRRLGIEATEHIPFQKFWADANKILKIPTLVNQEEFYKPCSCAS